VSWAWKLNVESGCLMATVLTPEFSNDDFNCKQM
jgi:hypothetical protein